jgi:Transposase DDE domain group 1
MPVGRRSHPGHGLVGQPDAWRSGRQHLERPRRLHVLSSEGIEYAIRLPANQILQVEIAPLLKRPVGRRAHYVQRFYKSFRYQASSWTRPRRVVAKVEWHPGELFARVGFIVTKRGTCEQWIKEGKGAIKWTRLSCRSFDANAVRLQLHALAYNLGNFLRTLATPEPIQDWSLTRTATPSSEASSVAHRSSPGSRPRIPGRGGDGATSFTTTVVGSLVLEVAR